MNHCFEFWSALAPFHDEIEDTNFDLASARRLLPEIQSPVLIVGAGQGLIVQELRTRGHKCDGVDLNPEMVRQAMVRRGLALIQADAKCLPFANGSYATIIFATGVVDFTGDEGEIKAMLAEARRVLRESGKTFVAFYKASAAQTRFLTKVGLLRDGQLALRESFELYLLNPVQMLGWIARRNGSGSVRAALELMRITVGSSMQEKMTTLKMMRVIKKLGDPRPLIQATPKNLPFRNAQEIQNLFRRLGIPVKEIRSLRSCCIACLEG